MSPRAMSCQRQPQLGYQPLLPPSQCWEEKGQNSKRWGEWPEPSSSVRLLSKAARPSNLPSFFSPAWSPSITIPTAGMAKPLSLRLAQSCEAPRAAWRTNSSHLQRGGSTLLAGEGALTCPCKPVARVLHTQHHVAAQKTSLSVVPLQAQAFSLPFYTYAYKLQEFPPCLSILCITKTPLPPLSQER